MMASITFDTALQTEASFSGVLNDELGTGKVLCRVLRRNWTLFTELR